MVLAHGSRLGSQHRLVPQEVVQRRSNDRVASALQSFGEPVAGVDGRPANGQLPLATGRDQLSIVDGLCQIRLVTQHLEVAEHHRQHVVGVDREGVETGEVDATAGCHHRCAQIGQLSERQNPRLRRPFVPVGREVRYQPIDHTRTIELGVFHQVGEMPVPSLGDDVRHFLENAASFRDQLQDTPTGEEPFRVLIVPPREQFGFQSASACRHAPREAGEQCRRVEQFCALVDGRPPLLTLRRPQAGEHRHRQPTEVEPHLGVTLKRQAGVVPGGRREVEGTPLSGEDLDS